MKIDPRTLNLELGLYSRVLVEVVLSCTITGMVLVTRIGRENNVVGDFFAEVMYEKLPKLCNGC